MNPVLWKKIFEGEISVLNLIGSCLNSSILKKLTHKITLLEQSKLECERGSYYITLKMMVVLLVQ